MKVQELLEVLEPCPRDAEVVIAETPNKRFLVLRTETEDLRGIGAAIRIEIGPEVFTPPEPPEFQREGA